MKHIFNIRTQTVQGKLCNKKVFNLKVAGLSILISWPLIPAKIILKHTAAPGTPWLKTNITNQPLFITMKIAAKIIKANTKIRIVTSKDELLFSCTESIFSRIRFRLGEIYNSLYCEAVCLATRTKIRLFGSGQAFQSVTATHSGNVSCGKFYKLIDWDYNDGSERVLSDVDNLNLADMDMIVN